MKTRMVIKSPKTVNNALAVLSVLLKKAVEPTSSGRFDGLPPPKPRSARTFATIWDSGSQTGAIVNSRWDEAGIRSVGRGATGGPLTAEDLPNRQIERSEIWR